MTNSSVIHLLSGREPFFESFDFDQVHTYEVKARAGYCAIKRILEIETGAESTVYDVVGKGPAYPLGWASSPVRFDNEQEAIEHFKFLYEAVRRMQVLLY